MKKTPLPSVSPTEFSEVCMSASLTKTVFNDPVTTMRTDMMRSFVLSPILSLMTHPEKPNRQRLRGNFQHISRRGFKFNTFLADVPRMGLSSLLPLSLLFLLSRFILKLYRLATRHSQTISFVQKTFSNVT